MKNKEKYANEIIDMALRDRRMAVNNETRKPCCCYDLECKDCFFDNSNYIIPQTSDGCTENRIHWANSEYVERKEFTEQEKAMVGALDKIKWVATDRNGETYGFINKPYKSTDIWKSDNIIDSIFLSGYSSCEFKAIKWEDDEPTSREEILGEGK